MIIECRKLNKTYKAEGTNVVAVNNVNFSVRQGEFVVVLGHSGSGKTTLLSLVGGLTRPDSGEVFIKDVENWKQTDEQLSHLRNRTIGFMFQFGSLIPSMTVKENVLLPLSFGSGADADPKLGDELLELVGLADKKNAFPFQLSGGQQRRVAIARAFINKPDIILADEPTGDLDEETENEILKIFHMYNVEKNTTFIVVTHNSHLADFQRNPRIVQMKAGVLSENEEQ